MQWPIPQWPTRHVYNPRASGGPGFVGITSGNPANTKGSYVTLVNGTTTTAGSWVYLNGSTNASGLDTSAVLDIAIGGAGSETIVAPDLLFGFRPVRGLLLPLHVPAGATVRARLACAVASLTATTWSMDVYGGEPDSGLSTPGRITGYGVTPASCAGTTITPSATTNTKGSYAQLTATTTSPIHALLVMVQGSSASISGNVQYNIDVAVGGSGSETPVIRDHLVEVNASEQAIPYAPEFVPLSLSIPSGVRLAARCSANSSSSAAIEVAVYGFTF